jgi:hypothetical protein
VAKVGLSAAGFTPSPFQGEGRGEGLDGRWQCPLTLPSPPVGERVKKIHSPSLPGRGSG